VECWGITAAFCTVKRNDDNDDDDDEKHDVVRPNTVDDGDYSEINH